MTQKIKRGVASLFFFLLPCLVFAGGMPEGQLLDVKQKITIMKTVTIKNRWAVSGTVTIEKKLIVFKGKFDIKDDKNGVVTIIWHMANQKPFKPYFKSSFRSLDSALKQGQQLTIIGNFDALFKQLFPKEARELAERLKNERNGTSSGQGSSGIDTDGDGIPDSEDTDDDNDGIPDEIDDDDDGDGIPDELDTDDADDDGYGDIDDNASNDDVFSPDSDNDGIPDNVDTDDDNDGIPDDVDSTDDNANNDGSTSADDTSDNGSVDDIYDNDDTDTSDNSSSDDTSYSDDSSDSGSTDTSSSDSATTSNTGTSDSSSSSSPEVTVSGTSDESCPNALDGSLIHLRKKHIVTYSDGSKDEGSCETVATYDLISTYDECSPRNDFVSSLTYLRMKVGYVNDEGNFVMTKSCHDTTTTFPHLKIVSDCNEYYDRSNNLVYESKKTYYVDTNGNMHFITDCQIDSTAFRAVSSDEYQKENSSNDKVDFTSMMAFRRYREYIQLGSKKEYVTNWRDDLNNPMPIYKDYDECSYFHDIANKESYRQFQYVYNSDGAKKSVSACQKDLSSSFAHVTDSKFCSPKVYDRKIYDSVSTYIIDPTGKRVIVSDCSLTDQERAIDATDIIKNYSKCEPRVDFAQNRAIASYVEQLSFGAETKDISTCLEDTSVYYPLTDTYEGCGYRVDTQSGRAYLQQRLSYNDGVSDHYVSDCKDSPVSTALVQSTDSCSPQVKGDQLVQYQETYYVDSNGDKKVVVACSPTQTILPITEDMKIYDYDSCPVSVNLDENKAYRRFQTFADVMGNKTLIKSCAIDLTMYYPIIETPSGCDLRHDFAGGVSYARERLVYLNESGKEIEVKACYDTSKVFNHGKMVDSCAPTYDSEKNVTYETKKTYYLDENGNVNFISGCVLDMNTEKSVSASDVKREYVANDYVDYRAGFAYKRYREYIVLSGDQKQYVSPVLDDLDNPMPIVRDYASCDFYHDNVNAMSYRQYEEVYNRDGVKKVVSGCQRDPDKSFTHVTDSKYCVPAINNKVAYEKESTYFLDETSSRVVVKECQLNGNEQILPPEVIEKNYDVCSPKIDYDALLVSASYKEQVTFDETVKFLTDCLVDADRSYPIAKTKNGCSFRINLEAGKAIQQKRYYYNNGVKDIYISACEDSDEAFDFIVSSATCSPTVSDDGLSFNEMAETYFIDGTGVKRTVIECSATGGVTEIPESAKFKDFTKCEPEINFEDLTVYGRYELYAKTGKEDVLIQSCSVDPMVTYPIEEDFSACSVRVDPVAAVAIQYKKLFYRQGNEDVYVSSCIASDITYPIKETVTGCSYNVDLENKVAIEQKRRYYKDQAGTMNYLSDCYDTANTTPIITSATNCAQTLSDDGLRLMESKESYYFNSLGEKRVVQACSPTGNLIDVPAEAFFRNYDNCDYTLSIADKIANRQYQTFVKWGNYEVMIEGCKPDLDIDYALSRDFSSCTPRIDFVNGEVTELVEWYFKDGVEDVYVTGCIESDKSYPIRSRTDICDAIPIENDPNNVIQQARLYYLDTQNQIQYVSDCQPTSTVLAVTREVLTDAERFIHNFPSGESYYAVVDKYGDQIIKNAYPSPDHLALTHMEESCGWVHDDANYRSTFKVRTYITDVLAGNAKVYLDECHQATQFISYANAGTVTKAGNNGGNSTSCAAGLYWDSSFANSRTCRLCQDYYCSSTTNIGYGLTDSEYASYNSISNWLSGGYRGVFFRYKRADGTNYDKWWKNYCGVKKATIAVMSYSSYCSSYSNNYSIDPETFGTNKFGWYPSN